jgi:hypothetical protein
MAKNHRALIITALAAGCLTMTRGFLWGAGALVVYQAVKSGNGSLEGIAHTVKTTALWSSALCVTKIFWDCFLFGENHVYSFSDMVGAHPYRSALTAAGLVVATTTGLIVVNKLSRKVKELIGGYFQRAALPAVNKLIKKVKELTGGYFQRAAIPAAPVLATAGPKKVVAQPASFWTTKRLFTISLIAAGVIFSGAKFQWQFSVSNALVVASIPLISFAAGRAEGHIVSMQKTFAYYGGWKSLGVAGVVGLGALYPTALIGIGIFGAPIWWKLYFAKKH